MLPGPSVTVRNRSAGKSLCLFTEVLDVKKKMYFLWVGTYKSNSKEIRSCNMLWSIIPKSKGH